MYLVVEPLGGWHNLMIVVRVRSSLTNWVSAMHTRRGPAAQRTRAFQRR